MKRWEEGEKKRASKRERGSTRVFRARYVRVRKWTERIKRKKKKRKEKKHELSLYIYPRMIKHMYGVWYSRVCVLVISVKVKVAYRPTSSQSDRVSLSKGKRYWIQRIKYIYIYIYIYTKKYLRIIFFLFVRHFFFFFFFLINRDSQKSIRGYFLTADIDFR